LLIHTYKRYIHSDTYIHTVHTIETIRMNLSTCKKKSIMLAGVVGVIVILAIVLPITTANSGDERNSKNSMSAAGVENSENDGDLGRGTDTDNNNAAGAPVLSGDESEGEGEGEREAEGEAAESPQIGLSATCPCFNAEDLDKASRDIASGSYTFYPDTTCKDSASGTNSITYTNDEMGYPAMLGYEVTIGECRKSDMIFMASAPEEAACRTLLNDKCTEHSSVFAAAAAAAALPVADESATCPCFNAEDLDKAAADVASGSYTFESATTCTGSDSGSNGIIYTNDSRGYPIMLGYEVRSDSCRKSDTSRLTSASENSACRSLLNDKCTEHSSVFAATAAAAPAPVADESATCPCFGTDDLDKAAVDVASGSYTFKSATTCTGSDSGSNGIIYTNDSRGYPIMLGYEVRSDSCRKSDTFRLTSASENSACRSLLTSKCAEYSSIFAAATAAATPNE
jgi:hypothetical protein